MPRDAIPMSADLAEPLPEPDPPYGSMIKALGHRDSRRLGALMFEAFAGTVDDDGSRLQDHIEVAFRTMAGQFGPVRRDASLAAVERRGPCDLIGAVVVTTWYGLPLVAFALVRPDWQRRGLGRALLSRSANALRLAGDRRWTLSVTRHNPAVRLYQQFGFREDQSLIRRPAR